MRSEMFIASTSEVRSGTLLFNTSKFGDGTAVVSCCETSLSTWNGNINDTWSDGTGHDTLNDGTTNGTWDATTAEYLELTNAFPLNENATLSIDGSQTTWASAQQYSTWEIVLLSTLAGLTSLVTVGGNLTVFLSFLVERSIRQPTNYFIASLACSDLLIGLISMPLYTVYLLTGANWPLGEVVCDLWLSVDYTACLCSIYTVFCITIDRFCSVSIPTKYRNWRTASKVRMVVAMTWILPTIVFFTTIFGWQFFVGDRTVPEGKCYVQYMENAVFNCALQVGYFWTTLVVMCALYAGIYRVALTLQQKSEAKLTKMASVLTVDATKGENLHRLTVANEKELPRDTTQPPGSSPDWELAVKGLPGRAIPLPPKALPVVSIAGVASTANGEQYSSSPGFLSDAEPSSPSVQTISHRRNTSPYVMMSSSHGPRSKDRGVIRTSGVQVGCNRLLRPPPREISKRFLQHYYQSQQLEVNVNESYRRGSSGDTQPTGPPRDHRCVNYLDGGEVRTIRCSEEELEIGNRPNGHSEIRVELMEGSSTNVDDVRVENLLLVKTADVARHSVPFQHRDETDASLQRSPVWKRRNGTFDDFHSCSVDREMAQMACEEEEEEEEYDDDVNRSRSVFTYSTTVDSFNDTVGGQAMSVSRFNCTRQVSDPCEGYHRQCYSIDYSTSDTLDESATPCDESSRWQLTEDSQMPTSSYYQTTSVSRGSRHVSNQQSRQSASQLSRTGKSSRRCTNAPPGSTRASLPGGGRKTVNRAKKALRTITIILGAFVACWTPWHVLSLIVGFCPDYGTALQTLYDISYWLCYLNSPINPFCYAFANHQLKKTFLRILKFDWHRT